MKLRTARPVAKLKQGKTDWYRIENKAATSTADVYIYDEIGFWGVTAGDFAKELAALDVTTIELRLNSPGGEVFDGIAIYNTLKGHKATVNITVDGLAASIASVIAMAGDTVTMGRGSQMMIHDGLGVCVGNAADMREMADLLDQTSDNIAGFYAGRAGGTLTSWRDLMRAETWYTADEAVKAGLADRVSEAPDAGEPVTNDWDLTIFNYAGRDKAPAPGEPDSRPADPPVPASAPELVPALVDFDPDAFRSAVESIRPPVPAFDSDLFRAGIAVVANDAPAVPEPAPTPEPDAPPTPIDPVAFRRALREARL